MCHAKTRSNLLTTAVLTLGITFFTATAPAAEPGTTTKLITEVQMLAYVGKNKMVGE